MVEYAKSDDANLYVFLHELGNKYGADFAMDVLTAWIHLLTEDMR